MDFQNANGGLVGSVRRLTDSTIALLKNRAELAILELQEEKARLISASLWGGLFIFSSLMAVMAMTCTLIFLFWDQKLNVAIALLVLYLIGIVAAFFLLKRRLKTPAPFAETVAQLKKDRAWLQN